MSEIKAAIRKALARSSSQQPVDTRTLLKLGDSTAISLALGELLDTREINTATSIKGGITTVLCWLTGAVVLNPGRQSIRLDGTPAGGQRQRPYRKPQTSPLLQQNKEHDMTPEKTGIASPITVAILSLVSELPGIGRAALIDLALKRAPGATEGQAIKSIGNLIHTSKKIRAEGVRSKREYYLNSKATVKPAAGAVPEKANPTARSLAKPIAAKVDPAKVQDDDFSIMLSESGNIHVCSGATTSVYTPLQAARLHRFIGLIQDVSA